MIKFISYTGKYPCLCLGVLTVEINGKKYKFGHDFEHYQFKENRYDNEDPNNSKEINADKKKYLVGTTVELAIEANSLSEAKDILYKKLKTMGLDVGTLNGFEIPDDDDGEE